MWKKRYIHVANKHMKRCSTSYIIREMQIKIKIRYHHTPTSMAKLQNTDNIKCCWGWGAIGLLIHRWWECKMVQPPWKRVGQFLTILNILLQYNPTILSLVFTQRSLKCMSTQKPPMDVYSRFIHNCPDLEAAKMSFSRWMDKYSVVHPETGILISLNRNELSNHEDI